MPAMLDCITGIFLFIGPVRATILGYDPLVAGSMVTARSLACCLIGLLTARILTNRNAVRLMFLGNIMMLGVCLLGLAAANLAMLYATSFLLGAFQVIFYTPFQLFMKQVDVDASKPLSRAVGSYTAAWCVGMSFGPFITGFLMRFNGSGNGAGDSSGWIYSYLAAAALTAAMLAILIWVAKNSREFRRRTPDPKDAPAAVPGGEKWPDLAWLGWSMGFFSLIALGMIKGVFPAEMTRAGQPGWLTGSLMMVLSFTTGVFAYAASARWRWLYSGPAMFGFGLLGTAGLLLFLYPAWAGQDLIANAWPYFAAMLLFGSYAGVAFLYSGFHALAHPKKAGRNISLNECFISAGVMTGPLLGGWLAKRHGFFPPFELAAVLIGLLGAFQLLAHRKYGKRRT
jgi:MFS family permease